jgi:hypothetical protein
VRGVGERGAHRLEREAHGPTQILADAFGVLRCQFRTKFLI